MTRAVALLMALALAACSAQTTPATPVLVADDGLAYWPADAWRVAPPDDVSIDGARIARLVARLKTGQEGAIQALLIIRHGYLVTEEYFGWSASTPHTLQSVTKSVTSLLAGIAVSDGSLAIDRPVLDVFPQYTDVQFLDARKRALAVRHLLTMRTGMDFFEDPYPGSPLDQLNRSTGDWVKFVLDRPMLGDPGGTWSYNSGGVITLGGILRATTGKNVDVFARERLFEPIGIRGEQWYRSPFDGLPHTGGGLSLRPQDLARIGYLVLRHGKWGDRQIVPQSWLDQSITAASTLGFVGRGVGYGFLWWLFPLSGTSFDQRADMIITGSGAQGQWLFIVPKYDLVVVFMSNLSDFSGPVNLLYGDVLPAVR